MGLGSLLPAFAQGAARTDGNGGLNGVIASPKRILRRIKQGHDPAALIIVHHRP